jgi:hypothetical protein
MSDARETHVAVTPTVTAAARLTAQGEELLSSLATLMANIRAIEDAGPWGTNEQYARPFKDAYFADADGAETVRDSARGVANRVVDCGTAVGVGAMTIEDADGENSRTVGGVM